MTHQIRLKSPSKVRVSLGSVGINVRTKSGFIPEAPMAQKFEELTDVNVTNVNDKYIIMYDAVTQKYTAVNPDEVLVAAATSETIQPGLPNEFIDTLDIDLDNKIDVDAGSF